MGLNLTTPFVAFRVGEHRYALPLGVVERILPAVAVTPLPGAPALVLGVIDIGGSVLPVFNLRRRFGLPERELAPEDQLLIAGTTRRRVALVIDEAWGVVEWDGAGITPAGRILPGLDLIRGVVQLEDGLVLIHDLEAFLSLEEAEALEGALDRGIE